MFYTALYPESTGGNELPFTLHRAGCEAVSREQRKRGGTQQTFEAADLNEALGHVIDSELEEMGYGAMDVKIHACTKRGS